MKTKIRLKRRILKNLGLNLKQIRLSKGISQEKLAFMVGVDRTYIGAIEQGTRSPSIYCLFVISEKLNVNLKDLLDFEVIK